jgi:tight adherence protein C
MTSALLLALAWATVPLGLGWRHRPVNRSVDPPRVQAERRPWAGGGPPGLRASPYPRRSAPLALIALGLLVVVGIVVGHPFIGVTSAACVAGGRVLSRRARARAAAAAREAALPRAIDLLVVAVAAGLSPRQGLQVVADRGPVVVRPAFSVVCNRLVGGEALADALPRLVDQIGGPARGLVRAVLMAERDGAPLRVLLGHLADDARRQRRHDLEVAIRRLPVRLAFPLVGCTLPAFLVLTVAPLLASGLSRLGPLTGGGP